MNKVIGFFLGISLLLVTGTLVMGQDASVGSSASASSSAVTVVSTGKGMTALEEAAKNGKYLFVFFQDGAASNSSELTKFEELISREAASSSRVVIDRKDSAEQAIVNKFQVQRAPMPLVLVVAPNGAITSGFPAQKLSETSIRDAFVSQGMQKSLGLLQQEKLVILALQNASTTSNEAAMKGAMDFCADPLLGTNAVLVTLDTSDPAEAMFLEKMRLSSTATEAQTILLAPPAVIVGQFSGAVTKDAIAAALLKASSGGGCGSGGCSSGCGS
ncbi:MAG: hypothetical protein WA705_30885 [Candidatus Ozemobacteraceae bacterium]